MAAYRAVFDHLDRGVRGINQNAKNLAAEGALDLDILDAVHR
jgi:hypothetical protein